MTAPTPSPSHRLADLEAGPRRRLIARTVLSTAGLVIALLAVYYVAPWDGGRWDHVAVRTVFVLVVLTVVAVVSVKYVVNSQYPMLALFRALVVVIGLALVFFASIYQLISTDDPNAFSEPLSRTDALYFALVTFTTVGYGDINAKTEAARIVVMAHMVVNVVVLGVLTRALINAARGQVGTT